MLVGEVSSAFGFAFIIGLGCISHYLTNHIGVKVLSEDDELLNPDSFIATRSYKDLKVLSDFGPKATGSDANEIHAVNFLLQRAKKIKDDSANISEITIDLQIVSGSHFDFAHYEGIQNVVVKLHGKSDKAVMINCHFDTEYGSYGAGDDGVNCCTMLEILRVMAKGGSRNEYSTIFLFNGSEEGNLEGIQASHGFITQHKWARDVKAFINLEAQGIGGKELLFRTGPKHDWLVKKYRQAVKKPFGHVFSEEMFETGILSSGTDFESFRDDGHVPGLDLAYCSGGWKYHTKFDHIRYMTNDSIQNTGNNVLELVKLMVNSDEVSNPPEGSPAVYFDFLGFFFVSYSKATGIIVNIVVSVLAVAIPFIVQIKMKLTNCGKVMKETVTSFVTILLSTIMSLAACFLMGLIMNSTANAMFWFNATILSLGVYSTLAVLVQVLVYHASSVMPGKFQRRNSKGKEFVRDKYAVREQMQARLNGVNLFWAVLCIVVTSLGLRLGYLMMIMLLISLITNIVMYFLDKILPKMRIHSWIFLHFLGHSFTFLWSSYLLLILWRVFIPITEKTYKANPEGTISLLCGLGTILSLSYFIPLTSLVKSRAILYSTLCATFVVSVILSYTSAGFPYSGSLAEPRVQRHYITHTQRTFYDSDGAVRFRDIGFFIKENERNTKRTLDLILDPQSLTPKNDDVMCQTEAFCGFPSYNESNAFWLKATEAPIVKQTQVKLNISSRSGNSVEMSFDVVGSFLTILYIMPEDGVKLTESTAGLSQLEWVGGKFGNFLKITYGKASPDPFTLILNLETTNANGSNLLKVTVVTIDSHFDRNPMAQEFKTLVDKFPDYTFVQVHQADVSSYTFK